MGLTLPIYLCARLLRNLCLIFGALLTLIVIGDFIEISRDVGSRSLQDVPVLSMALLHAPSVMSKALPFVVMIASLVTFLGLARSSELVVLRAAGISVWRILAAPLVFVIALGFGAFAAYNPISAGMLSQYDRLNIKYFKGNESRLSISQEGLWLRQANDDGNTVIHAGRSSPDGTELIDVTLYIFDGDGRMTEQLTAPTAELRPGSWHIRKAERWQIGTSGSQSTLTQSFSDTVSMKTDLTSNLILESFADPRALSFWSLSGFIETLEASGFSPVRHQLHLHNEMAKPLLFAAMLLIGAGFSMQHVRFGTSGRMILGCVIAGFGLFFMADIAEALGASGALPVLVAAWVVPTSATLFGAGILLYLEDG